MCIFELSLKLGLDAFEKWYTILEVMQGMCTVGLSTLPEEMPVNQIQTTSVAEC